MFDGTRWFFVPLALAFALFGCDSGAASAPGARVDPVDPPERVDVPASHDAVPDACEVPSGEVKIEHAADVIGCVYCGEMFDCPCDDGRLFGTAEACRIDVAEQVELMKQAGEDAALTYDPTCIARFVDDIDTGGCGAQLYDFSECRPACSPYHGAQGIDQECEYFDAGLNDCAKGLVCINGVCQDPCQNRATKGESCETRACADGLACSETGYCVALPVVGQRCLLGECAGGAFCDAADPVDMPGVLQCFELVADGDDCRGDLQCESSHCWLGKCTPKPQEGEDCPARVCGPWLACVEGICEQTEAAICYAGTPI